MPVPNDTASPRRIVELDGLRGLAILLVVVWHYIGNALQFTPGTALFFWTKPLKITGSGVDLFFVLSGFLIGGILMDNKGAPHYFKTFYIRRICRIFPLYYLWLALFVFVSWATGAAFKGLLENPLPLWSYATFTQNFLMAQQGRFGPDWLSVTWSLAIEEQFYILLPLLIYLSPHRVLPWVVTGLIAIGCLLRPLSFFVYATPGLSASVLMPCRADALLLGVLCAYLTRSNVTWVSRSLLALYAVLIGSFAVLIGGLPFTQLSTLLYVYPLLALAYAALLLIAVTERRGIVTTVVRSRPLCRLGEIAYGVYLFHQAVNAVLHFLCGNATPQLRSGSDWMITAASFALTIALAWLSWRFVEKPFVSIGHRFSYRNAAR